MINAVQLSLFTPQFPDWKEINTKWVFDYLSALYPEMKFICEEIQDGFDNTSYIVIKQTAFKKVGLEYYCDEYSKSVTWCKNRNFVSCNLEQYFGDWSGMGESYDNWEKFLEMIPIRIKQCKDRWKEYKNEIRKKKNNARQI